MRSRLPLLIVGCALCGAIVAAQQQSRPADQQPPVTFKVEVNYVEIDAIVTDQDGNIVRGLTQEDFEVTEQGKPQKIGVFSFVDIPVEPSDPPLHAAAPIEPDVRSNRREFDGRVFVIVLDDLHTHFARSARVKAAARQFVERHLGANDLAAVVHTGGSRGGAQEFTSSRRLLLQAIDRFMGQKERSATLEKIEDLDRRRGIRGGEGPAVDALESLRAQKARNALSTLKGVAEYLTGVRGRRKAVVYFSEGIDYDVNNVIENRYASDIRDEMQAAIAVASRANVSFYAVDPRGLGGFEEGIEIASVPIEDNTLGTTSMLNETRLAQDSLRTVSDETGGFAALNRNNFQDAFARIIRENSSYYVLGYYSDDTRRDGRFRQVDVRVRRPGVQVRARKGYVAPRGRVAEAGSAAAEGTSAALREALNSPVPVSALGLSAFAAPFRGSGDKASISISLEIDGSRFKFAEKDGRLSDDVEISIIAYDDRGRAKDGGHDSVTITPRPQTRDLILRHGVRVLRRLELEPGRYNLRIGARESGSGAVGSVMLDLEVPDFAKAGLAMSGIVLTSAGASRVPTARPDELLKGVLPASPTTMREFVRQDQIAAYAEIYDNQTRTPHRVAIKTTVLSDEGVAVFTASEERRSEELGKAGGGYGHLAKVPLQGFAPGRYLLRIEAQTLLANGPTAVREVEFRVR
jgi:VWFA-related protein